MNRSAANSFANSKSNSTNGRAGVQIDTYNSNPYSGITFRISEWVSCRLIHMLRSWRAWFMLFDSLGNRYENVFISRISSWGIRLLTLVMIGQNSAGIWKRIQRSLVGFSPQPSVWQVDILGCGHLCGIFDKFIPVWWDGAYLHLRHSNKPTVKYYVVLWNDANYGGITYNCDASSMEGRVSNIHPDTWTRFPFWWTCSSIVLEHNV